MDKQPSKAYHYQWHSGNTFELLVNGENYFPRIFNAIENARHVVLFEQYLVESGNITTQLIDALYVAAERGVTVMIMIDSYGSAKLNDHDRLRLSHPNIHLLFYNPLQYHKWYNNLHRDHRKLVVVDHDICFTGGTGFTDEFDTQTNPRGWHDIMMQSRGPVVLDWADSFIKIWQSYGVSPYTFPAPQTTASTEKQARVSINQTPTNSEINRTLVKCINQATQRVWIASPYFITTGKIRRAIMKAAIRGVDVRLLLAGLNSDHPWVTRACRNYYSKLLKSNIRILEYQPVFMHAKAILCDQWVSIGSSNLDRWNLRWNLDANQEVNDKKFAEEISNWFEHNFAQSLEVDYLAWQQRNWWQRTSEWLSSRLVVLLNLVGGKYRP